MGSRRRQPPPQQRQPQYQLPYIKYEPEDEDLDMDDRTAQLLTPQVTIDVPQRRKPFVQHRNYEEEQFGDGDEAFVEESEPGYDMDFLSDNSHGSASADVKVPLPRVRERNGKRASSGSVSSGGGGSGARPKKMYELDVTLYPEAAAARASYENRIRKKVEKEEMINTLNFLTERNKVLEEENAALKDKLLEYESNVTSQDWFLFFRSAGIRSGDDRKYAAIFDANRIKPNLLLDLNEQWLRDMNVTAVGDILAILKHAKLVHAKTNGRKLHFKSPPMLQRSPGPSPLKKSSAGPSSVTNGIQITSVRSLNN